jgi:hypothetical protein
MSPSGRDGRRGPQAPPADARDPIAVFQIGGIVEGWIPRPEGRVSDELNQRRALRIHPANPDGTLGEAVELDLDDVVAIAAAPRPPSLVRAARRQHAVTVSAGLYRVSGVAYLPLGADPSRYVASAGRRWMPMTGCTVVAGPDEWAVDVVIVNLDHVDRGAR